MIGEIHRHSVAFGHEVKSLHGLTSCSIEYLWSGSQHSTAQGRKNKRSCSFFTRKPYFAIRQNANATVLAILCRCVEWYAQGMHALLVLVRKHTPAAWIARLPTKAVATYILECKRVYCCNETNSITQHAVAAASSGHVSTCLTDWTVLIDGLAWREPMGPPTVHSREHLPLLPLRVSCEPWRSSGLAAFLASSSHKRSRRILLYYCIIVLYYCNIMANV